MKTETLTIPASEVRKDDRILSEQVMNVARESQFVTLIKMSGLEYPVRIPSEWGITVTRAVPDEPPGGRMSYEGGCVIELDGVWVGALPSVQLNALWRRVCDIYNRELDAPRAVLVAKLRETSERMRRARRILTDDNPRPECNWGVLNTDDIDAVLAKEDGK